ncbi:class II aldolase/adducin family protein, partial [Pseudomonas sp. KHB2.9]
SQQSSFVLAGLGYHDYEGVALRDEEKPRLQDDLGANTFLILRNHGLLTVGRTVADAFLAMYILESACQIQISAQAGHALLHIDRQILEGVVDAARVQTEGLGGGFVWPALLRKLDRLDTGYKQ